MHPDQGCYQERYRLTFPVARGAAISLVSLIPVIFSHQPLPWVILSPVAFVLTTVPWLLAVASRKIAFRADMAGITLGADPLSWPFRHASAVFVPWSDAEAIALYQGGGPPGWRIGDDPCIGIQRRHGVPALSRGNKPARRCPEPGVAAGAARPVTAWRLDRDRLAAVVAAAAPASLSSMLEPARTRALRGRAEQAVPQRQDPWINRLAHPSRSRPVRPDLLPGLDLGARGGVSVSNDVRSRCCSGCCLAVSQ